jgi:cytochrome P450
VAVLDDEIGRILADRRGRPEARDDLLGRLMASGVASEQELRDHCVTMFVAGHDTVAMAMTWAFYLLAQHPEAEARLHAEATRVIGDGPLCAEHVEQLAYAAQVVDEALRLYPQPGTLFRTPLEDDVVDGHRVPAGAEVVLSIHTLHRDPALWPDPLVFRPERFAPEAVAQRDRHAHVPFGAGQRACVGKAFAQQEAAALVALLARDFRFELAVEPPVATEIAAVTAPRGGLPMRVRRRVTPADGAPPGR